MPYSKPTLKTRDVAEENACCKECVDNARREQCGAGWNNNGGSFTIAYNFGDNCGSYQFGYFAY